VLKARKITDKLETHTDVSVPLPV